MYGIYVTVDLQTRARCTLDNLRCRVACAAARFQPRLACFRQRIGGSDESISLSQILSGVKDLTQ